MEVSFKKRPQWQGAMKGAYIMQATHDTNKVPQLFVVADFLSPEWCMAMFDW